KVSAPKVVKKTVKLGKLKELYDLQSQPASKEKKQKTQLSINNKYKKNHLERHTSIATSICKVVFIRPHQRHMKVPSSREGGRCSFLSKRAEMEPVQYLCTHTVTGTLSPRNTIITSQYKFLPSKTEMKISDNSNDHLTWSACQRRQSRTNFLGLNPGHMEVPRLAAAGQRQFWMFQKAWMPENCTLMSGRTHSRWRFRRTSLSSKLRLGSWILVPSAANSKQFDKQSLKRIRNILIQGLKFMEFSFKRVKEAISFFRKSHFSLRVVLFLCSLSSLSH
uniref:phosphoribosylaminoimidazolesuccinocarboxamide synthase n=1 Tax=Sus scrofa TaxID=9823 RepID=A0A8D1WF06_PIG